MSGKLHGLAPAERPYLIFTVGFLQAFPPDFNSLLAGTIDAEHISSRGIRASLETSRANRGDSRPIRPRNITQRFASLAINYLLARRNVVAEMSFNTANSRAYSPLHVVQEAGAIAVALYGTTGTEVIARRLRTHDPSAPVERRYEFIDRYLAETVKPGEHEAVHVLELDGSADDPGMLVPQVVAQLPVSR